MAWLHIEIEKQGVKVFEMTDDDGEVIAIGQRAEFSTEPLEYNLGGSVHYVPRPSGNFSLDFFVPDLQKLQAAIYGPHEKDEDDGEVS